jgi:hypothetical protein
MEQIFEIMKDLGVSREKFDKYDQLYASAQQFYDRAIQQQQQG